MYITRLIFHGDNMVRPAAILMLSILALSGCVAGPYSDGYYNSNSGPCVYSGDCMYYGGYDGGYYNRYDNRYDNHYYRGNDRGRDNHQYNRGNDKGHDSRQNSGNRNRDDRGGNNARPNRNNSGALLGRPSNQGVNRPTDPPSMFNN
jgi:hypothetical protein